MVRFGAGEGNRTLVISLEGCCSTIELHPQVARMPADFAVSVLLPPGRQVAGRVTMHPWRQVLLPQAGGGGKRIRPFCIGAKSAKQSVSGKMTTRYLRAKFVTMYRE